MEISETKNGFYAFRVNFPHYTKSVFMKRTEIVTDGKGTILGVTNPDKLINAFIPSSDGTVQILEVGEGAFSHCLNLREITFSDNLEIVATEAFKGCVGLSRINLPGTLYEIGDGAFSNTGLVALELPQSVEEIPSRCFMDSRNLRSVTPGDKIRKIGVLAFAGCSSLNRFDIPRGTAEIPDGAFMSSGIGRIHIPRSVRRIGELSFSNCRRLEKIYYEGGSSDFRRIIFGNNWRRGLNPDCALYLRDEKGEWYNVFEGEKKDKEKKEERRDGLDDALAVFSLTEIPSRSVLSSLFRQKAMAFHPDRISSLDLDSEFTVFANEKFRLYKEAYDTILPYTK